MPRGGGGTRICSNRRQKKYLFSPLINKSKSSVAPSLPPLARFGSYLSKASSSARSSGASLLASMASLFRARRQAAESGSGGKILHDRVRDPAPRPSPYARSPPLALPPPPPPAGSPRWFLGFVSGAGKLISSVFRADSSSPNSSDYSSDHDRSSSRSG